MSRDRSFAGHVKSRFYDPIYSAVDDFVEQSWESFDLRISNVHNIGGVAMSDMEIEFVSVGDLPNLKIEFDVVVDAEIEVTEGDYHYDDYDICNQWLTVRCAGDLACSLDDFQIVSIAVYQKGQMSKPLSDALVPYILIFYIVLGFLEDLGYLPRLAVLFDRFMHRVGLHGFSIIPMMLAMGCNIPGILAVRNIESRRQRFITATLTAITIPCFAQSAIIFSITATYGTGYVVAILGTILSVWLVLGSVLSFFVKGTTDTLIMEVPPYRLPAFKVQLRNLGSRIYGFLTDAFPYVLGGILFVNILTILGAMDFIGNLAAPVITGIFGLPEGAVASFVVGIVRKDAAVALLEPLNISGAQMVVGVTLLIIYFPCMATFVIMLKELGFADTFKSFMIMVIVTLLVGTYIRAFMAVFNDPWIYVIFTVLLSFAVMLVLSRIADRRHRTKYV